MKRGIIFK